MAPILFLLNNLFDIVVTMNFGIIFVPLGALVFAPALGVPLVAVVISAIPVARRIVAPQPWRREYGWSLLMPGVGLWQRRRLLHDDPAAAALSLRLAAIGGIFMLLASTVANDLSRARYETNFSRAMLSDAPAVAYMRSHGPYSSLEGWHHTPAFRRLAAPQRARFDRAWRTAAQEYWRNRIQRYAPNTPLHASQALLNYDRLAPSQKAAFNAAWHALNHGTALDPTTP